MKNVVSILSMDSRLRGNDNAISDGFETIFRTLVRLRGNDEFVAEVTGLGEPAPVLAVTCVPPLVWT